MNPLVLGELDGWLAGTLAECSMLMLPGHWIALSRLRSRRLAD